MTSDYESDDGGDRHRSSEPRLPLNRVYVGNILENVKKEDLEVEFAKYGKLSSCWVAFNPVNNRSISNANNSFTLPENEFILQPGFAFVEFDDEKDAKDAVSSLNGSDFMGSKIRVEISPNRGRGRGGRGGGRGRGFGDRGGFRGGFNRGGGGRGSYGGDRDGYRGSRGSYNRNDRSRSRDQDGSPPRYP